jgi:hypothetical protein
MLSSHRDFFPQKPCKLFLPKQNAYTGVPLNVEPVTQYAVAAAWNELVTTRNCRRVPVGGYHVRRFFFLVGGVGQTQAWMPAFMLAYSYYADDMSLESDGGMIYWQRKTDKLGEKPVPVPLCPPHPTWIDPGANPGFRGERPATNDLSHGTRFTLYGWIKTQRSTWSL